MWKYEKDAFQKKKKKDSTKADNNNSISNELTQNGSHFLTSVKVSYKQVSNI